MEAEMISRMSILGVVVVGTVMMAMGCAPGGRGGGGGGGGSCTPGVTLDCTCSDGSHGAQTCQADHTYGACSCMTVTPDGGSGSPDMGGSPDLGSTPHICTPGVH